MREIQKLLPSFLCFWIDEIEIPYGTYLSFSIKTAIQKNTDLLVIFLTNEAVASEWVKKELRWAIEREKIEKRNFIIPVLLNRECWNKLPQTFQQRKYILCNDFTLDGINSFSKKLYNELFSYFLKGIELIPDDELLKRKKRASEIAREIHNDQSKAIGNEVLNKTKLEEIISFIDPLNKILLLFLYELSFGKYANMFTIQQLDRMGWLSFEFEVPKIGIWVHKISMASMNLCFRELTFDYGLGDNNFFVRDIFLNEIKNLSDSDRKRIFIGMKIIRILQERYLQESVL